MKFCTGTLAPNVIDMYMEQLRAHLIAGNYEDAKKDALIIGENKIPGGKTLPGPNHNWEALEIEEI